MFARAGREQEDAQEDVLGFTEELTLATAGDC
jgi:hypothetical protein